jgi:uncharacterized protein
MTLVALAIALGAGCLVGLVSGLLGIGGGVIIVPILYLLISNPEWSGVVVGAEHQAALAHATSLAIVLPTTLTGLWFYRRHGSLDTRVIVPMGLAAVLGAPLGAALAVALPGPALKVGFGTLLLFTAWQTIRVKRAPVTVERTDAAGEEPATAAEDAVPGPQPSPTPGLGPCLVGGGGIGMLSALMGIGGGVVAIPVLLHWVRLELGRIAPTSLGIVAFAAPAGILSYALAGRAAEGLPAETLGYLHLPLAAALIPGAVLMAPVGVRLHHRIPIPVLRRCFALLLLVVGALILRENLPLLTGSM